MTWNEEEIIQRMEDALSNRVAEAGAYLQERVQVNMGIQGSRKDRSKPGEFPRRQTGQTLESVIHEHTDDEIAESRVGSLSKVAFFLTKGTVKMEPREFLLRTLNEEKPAIIEMIGGDNQTGAT